jgi:hypothetical protein
LLTLLAKADSAKQVAAFKIAEPPYGISVFGVPYKADYLWKLQAVAEIPATINVALISKHYYRLTLMDDMELEEAKKVLQSLEDIKASKQNKLLITKCSCTVPHIQSGYYLEKVKCPLLPQKSTLIGISRFHTSQHLLCVMFGSCEPSKVLS